MAFSSIPNRPRYRHLPYVGAPMASVAALATGNVAVGQQSLILDGQTYVEAVDVAWRQDRDGQVRVTTASGEQILAQGSYIVQDNQLFVITQDIGVLPPLATGTGLGLSGVDIGALSLGALGVGALLVFTSGDGDNGGGTTGGGGGGVVTVPGAPVFTSPTASLTTVENSTGAIYTASANDPEGDTVTYSLSGADAALFTLDANTGALSFNALPDYECVKDADRDNVYDVTVTASDPGGAASTQAVSVAVTNGDVRVALDPASESIEGRPIGFGNSIIINADRNGNDQLVAIDKNDLGASPTVLADLTALGMSRTINMEIIGNTLYFSSSIGGDGELYSLDLSSPGSLPIQVTDNPTGSTSISGLHAVGNLLYFGTRDSGGNPAIGVLDTTAATPAAVTKFGGVPAATSSFVTEVDGQLFFQTLQGPLGSTVPELYSIDTATNTTTKLSDFTGLGGYVRGTIQDIFQIGGSTYVNAQSEAGNGGDLFLLNAGVEPQKVTIAGIMDRSVFAAADYNDSIVFSSGPTALTDPTMPLADSDLYRYDPVGDTLTKLTDFGTSTADGYYQLDLAVHDDIMYFTNNSTTDAEHLGLWAADLSKPTPTPVKLDDLDQTTPSFSGATVGYVDDDAIIGLVGNFNGMTADFFGIDLV